MPVMRRPSGETVLPTSISTPEPWAEGVPSASTGQRRCLQPAIPTALECSTARSSRARVSGSGAESSCRIHSQPSSGTPTASVARATASPRLRTPGAATNRVPPSRRSS